MVPPQEEDGGAFSRPASCEEGRRNQASKDSDTSPVMTL